MLTRFEPQVHNGGKKGRHLRLSVSKDGCEFSDVLSLVIGALLSVLSR